MGESRHGVTFLNNCVIAPWAVIAPCAGLQSTDGMLFGHSTSGRQAIEL